MIVQINTDNRTPGSEDIGEALEHLVRARLSRVADRLTRVEVHVGDVNGDKGGVDMRAAVELRPASLDPVTATDTADTVERAVSGAADKALTAFDRIVGRQTTRKGH